MQGAQSQAKRMSYEGPIEIYDLVQNVAASSAVVLTGPTVQFDSHKWMQLPSHFS